MNKKYANCVTFQPKFDKENAEIIKSVAQQFGMSPTTLMKDFILAFSFTFHKGTKKQRIELMAWMVELKMNACS